MEESTKNQTITFDQLYRAQGGKFYLNYTVTPGDSREHFWVEDADRMPVIYFLVLFIVLVLLVGGIRGLRGLLSLTGSILLIIYVLLPGIPSYPPF